MVRRNAKKINAEDVLDYISDNGVQYVRLAFCDIFGNQKNVTILATELPRAFEHGVSFDGSSLPGLMNVAESDLVLMPDPSTFYLLDGQVSSGPTIRLFCDIKRRDGQSFSGDCRGYLKNTVQDAAALGYSCQVRTSCEFYLFETDERGRATHTPIDQASSFDIPPMDKGHAIRERISEELEGLGIHPEYLFHERGPGQNEIDYERAPALMAADQLLLFKNTVKVVADRNGTFASFLPKPFSTESGNGLHLRFSVTKDGNDIFGDSAELGREGACFAAGIMAHARELTAFLNPHPNSYARLGCFEAPLYITWSRQNRCQMMRLFNDSGRRGYAELRSPDPSVNPYLAYGLVIAAGLDGIKKNMPLPDPVDRDLTNVEADVAELPATLQEAIQVARSSSFINEQLGDLSDKYFEELQRLCDEDDSNVSHEENLLERYFLNV